MQAQSIRYLDTGEVELITVEVGDPGYGEIQLEAAACGICSWDIATCRQAGQMAFPAPPGHEGVGYVRRVGPGVTGIRVGDRDCRRRISDDPQSAGHQRLSNPLFGSARPVLDRGAGIVCGHRS